MLFLYRGILKEVTYMDHKDTKNAELDPLPTLFHHDPLPTYYPFLRTLLSSCPPETAAIPYCLC